MRAVCSRCGRSGLRARATKPTSLLSPQPCRFRDPHRLHRVFESVHHLHTALTESAGGAHMSFVDLFRHPSPSHANELETERRATMKAEPTAQALRMEYHIAQNYLSSLDSRVWAVYAVVVTVTVGALAISGQADLPDFSTAVTSFGAICLLMSWWELASRWWFYGDTLLIRMRQIEERLGISLVGQIQRASADENSVCIKELSSLDKAAYCKAQSKLRKRLFGQYSQKHAARLSALSLGGIHLTIGSVALFRLLGDYL